MVSSDSHGGRRVGGMFMKVCGLCVYLRVCMHACTLFSVEMHVYMSHHLVALGYRYFVYVCKLEQRLS